MHELIDPSSDDPIAAALTPDLVLRRFCHAVGALVDVTPAEHVPARVAALLPDLLAVPGLLTTEQRTAPADAYGRNRIFVCPLDKFSVLALVWPPGVSTPIHDHRDWCAFGVYSGEIEETTYLAVDPSSHCTVAAPSRTIRHRMGSAVHLPLNAPNIHRIHNPTDDVAISIHVYGGNCEALGPNLDRVYTVRP